VIIGLGIDVVELDRIRRSLDRFGERFLARVLTPAEIDSLRGDRPAFVAARFAAKEAASKALGTGFRRGVNFQTIELADLASGKPEIRFLRQARARFLALGGRNAHVSLTHGRDVAAAVVVLEN
jgi:holo-[acyl-carrier protein] synthase